MLKPVLILLLTIFLCVKNTLQKTAVDSNLLFAKDILKVNLARHEKENFIISPFFIQRMLTLAIFGTKGQTLKEIKNATRLYDVDEDEYLTYFQKIPKNFAKNDHLLYGCDLRLRKIFSAIAEKYFEVIPQTLNASNPLEITFEINKLVEQESKQFRDLLPSDFVTMSESIVFLNTVLYSNQWKQTFDKDKSRIGKFFDYGVNEVVISAMYGVKAVGYAELDELNAVAIQMPFKDPELKMLILLPNQGVKDINWPNLESLDDILDSMQLETVSISLPSFHVEAHFDLATILPIFGLNTFFGPSANFGKAFMQFSQRVNAQFFHAARLQVTEFGSNVKVGDQRELAESQDEPDGLTPRKFFVVERPFVFLIHSNDAIYLAGHIATVGKFSQSGLKIKSEP